MAGSCALRADAHLDKKLHMIRTLDKKRKDRSLPKSRWNQSKRVRSKQVQQAGKRRRTCSTCCAYNATLSLFLPPLIAIAVMANTVGRKTYLQMSTHEQEADVRGGGG
jgi:hypothetical protein